MMQIDKIGEPPGKYFPTGMKRNIERQDTDERYPKIEKCRIGIIGLTEGAGVSFLTLLLARAISGYGLVPAIVELGKGGIYDSLGMAERFSGRGFFNFHRALHENRKMRSRANFDEGINWALRCPGDDQIRLGEVKMMKLIDNIQGEVVLCDFSGVEITAGQNPLMDELLKDLETLIAVVDPLPSKLIKGFSRLREISVLSGGILYVINKFNSGVNRSEMLKLLKVRDPLYIPFIAPEEIYEAEYNCRIACGSGAAAKMIKEPVKCILKRAIPPDILKFSR